MRNSQNTNKNWKNSDRQGSSLLRYVITAAVGLIAAVVIMFSKSIFSQSEVKTVMQILSDAFFIPGVCIAGGGLIVFASHGGAFDMLAYGIRLVFTAFRRKEKRKYKDFYEYKQSKEGKKESVAFMLIIGVAMIAAACVFLILYYNF